MSNEEHVDEEIEDLEPATEEAEDVKGGLNFAADPAFKYEKIGQPRPMDEKSLNFRKP